MDRTDQGHTPGHGPRGSGAVSMSDVAAAAGVSQQTVSRVANGMPNVSEKTRERVLAAMQELGFRPNYAGRSLRGGRYRAIGLCVYDITKIGNLTMLDGILAAARKRGRAITMIEMREDEAFSLAEASHRMAALPVDGMIIGMSRMAPDFETFMPQPGMSTVIVTMYAHPRCTTVDSDHYGCSHLVMEHLFEHGHEQIRFVGGPDFSIDSQFREAGWRDALASRGIEPVEPLRGDWTANSGYEAGVKLARDRAATAIYVANDQMALGVIAALREAGRRVPEDVSVVGIDDSLVDTIPNVELTTVRFDLRERGQAVFEHAMHEPERQPYTVRIPGTLIRRRTVADRA
ncbi:LacI family DNA-binding transcriptional regulator [Collinsella vaginalis]|uniref:LacI family DNA-binding transcriptional regulator n=1 Tax=Collinsella vaginalis TaxID=1870987 RepID=UPI001FE441A1|nr:LacI family DNA-binding transcriptional regulator [Collinsella vaginalis]